MKLQNILIFLVATIYSYQINSQTPDLSGSNFFKDGTGNIINLTDGIIYKDLGDGALLNLSSGELYKRIADGTIIKLDTKIAVPIKIK